MTGNDLPVVAFFKHLLDPFIIWSMLILTTWMYDEDFTSYYLELKFHRFGLNFTFSLKQPYAIMHR